MCHCWWHISGICMFKSACSQEIRTPFPCFSLRLWVNMVPPVSLIIIAQSLIGETEKSNLTTEKNEYEQWIDFDPRLICCYNFRHFEASWQRAKYTPRAKLGGHATLGDLCVPRLLRGSRDACVLPPPLLFADIGHCSQAMLNVNFVFPV